MTTDNKASIKKAFFKACHIGDFSNVEKIASENSIDANWADEASGYKILQVAFDAFPRKPDSVKIVEFLLTRGADPETLIKKYGGEDTPILHEAVIRDAIDIFKLLLNFKADVFKIHDSVTVLYKAMAYGDQKRKRLEREVFIDAILAHGCTNSSSETLKKFYQLCDHIATNNLEAGKHLLETVEDVDFQDVPEISPLRFAVYKNMPEWVKLLLSRNAKPNYLEIPTASTVLHEAVLQKNLDIIQSLVDRGSDLNNLNENAYYPEDVTPIMLAVRTRQLEILRFLLEGRTNLEVQDTYGETALHLAQRVGKTGWQFTELLLKHKADANIKDYRHLKTPIYDAIKTNQYESLKLLADNGADLETRDRQGNYPIHWACIHADAKTVRILLERGADPNVQNFEHIRPLTYVHKRFQKGFEIVDVLLEFNVDTNIPIITYVKNED